MQYRDTFEIRIAILFRRFSYREDRNTFVIELIILVENGWNLPFKRNRKTLAGGKFESLLFEHQKFSYFRGITPIAKSNDPNTRSFSRCEIKLSIL